MAKSKSYGYKELQELLYKNAKIYHYRIEYKAKKDIPTLQGIYVMFEKNQLDKKDKQRIVRVGKAVDLQERLWTHFTKKVDKSILRKHIHSALVERDKPKQVTEKDISNYIQNNISFALIYVPKMLFVDELEKRMIRTVADYSKNPQNVEVTNWLGSDCNNKTVRDYHIWNSQDVKYDCPLDKAYFDLIECGLVRK